MTIICIPKEKAKSGFPFAQTESPKKVVIITRNVSISVPFSGVSFCSHKLWATYICCTAIRILRKKYVDVVFCDFHIWFILNKGRIRV